MVSFFLSIKGSEGKNEIERDRRVAEYLKKAYDTKNRQQQQVYDPTAILESQRRVQMKKPITLRFTKPGFLDLNSDG